MTESYPADAVDCLFTLLADVVLVPAQPMDVWADDMPDDPVLEEVA